MGKKILIIDDNEVDLIIVKRCLSEAGYAEIITAQDACEGIKKAKEEKPDLVISDTLLGSSNGFEVCAQIKNLYSQTNQASPKIIIMTGFIDAVDAVKARKVGADDYCAKTSDCLPLIEAVKKLI